METVEKKEEVLFQDVLDSFLIFSEKVLSYSHDGVKKVSENSSNKLKICLGYYKDVFNKTRTKKIHLTLFEEVYKKCRPLMLAYPDIQEFMGKFMNETIVIKINKESNSRIYLSAIFRYCTKIAQEIDKKYQDKLEHDAINDPASAYPESFMLHLFRLFSFCADETDKNQLLNPKVEQLERSLNLKPNEAPSAGGSGFDSILHFSKKIAKEFGLNMPPQIDTMATSDVEGMINNLMKNEQLKGSVKEALGNIDYSDPSKLQDVFTNLAKVMESNVKNPPADLVKAMNTTANS